MIDRLRVLLAGLFFLAALVLPLGGLGYGWWRWDFGSGLLMMMAVFAVFFLLGFWALWSVEDLSWLAAMLPFVSGGLYTALPDALPFPADDAAATTAGALFTFALMLRRNPRTPRWVLFPLLAAGVYAFFGGIFPGPLDEVLVDLLVLLITWGGARQRGLPQPARVARPAPRAGKVFIAPEDEPKDAEEIPPLGEDGLPHVPPFVDED